jgi:hypothetical protein
LLYVKRAPLRLVEIAAALRPGSTAGNEEN